MILQWVLCVIIVFFQEAIALTIIPSSVTHPLRGHQMLDIDEESIVYKMGAPVLTGPVRLYYIYYGDWSDQQKEILEHFGDNVGDSDWYTIQKST